VSTGLLDHCLHEPFFPFEEREVSAPGLTDGFFGAQRAGPDGNFRCSEPLLMNQIAERLAGTLDVRA
jgi:hypothetical protein